MSDPTHQRTLGARRADFKSRADYSPESVYFHPRRPIRYLPVHYFADEQPGAGIFADAWCEFPTEVALVETQALRPDMSTKVGAIFLRRDRRSPHFLKVRAAFDPPGATRADFEKLVETVADHPWAVDGFSKVVAGAAAVPLPIR